MRPVIYQIFTRLYGARGRNPQPWGGRNVNGCGTMSALTAKELEVIRAKGFTHLWCTGLIRHATCTNYKDVPACNPRVVKGVAGSPYAITDYYDIDPDLAVDVENRRSEYAALVKRVHKAGLKLVIDFVPNHVSREYHSICCPGNVRDLGIDDNRDIAFSPSNNFYYIPGESLHTDHLPVHDYAASAPLYEEFPARATGNDVFHAWPGANDWYETVKLNYGVDYSTGQHHFDPVPDTWLKMTDILLYWAGTGVDAFRCDMAEMVPVDFWHYATTKVRDWYPDVQFIAEVYNPAMYRDYIYKGGFDYLYDKVGLYDCLRDVMCHHRWAGEITHAWQSVDDIRGRMLSFLENHDEQRIASPQFSGNALAGRPGMAVAVSLSSAPVMVYAGQEVGEPALDAEGYSGQDGRTTIFDYWTVRTLRRMQQCKLTEEEADLQLFYQRLLLSCNSCDALREGGLYDLMYVNPMSERFDAEHIYVCLRHTKDEKALVVANFAEECRSADVVIPAEAFAHCNIKERKRPVELTDILTGNKIKTPVMPDQPIALEIPAQNALILTW